MERRIQLEHVRGKTFRSIFYVDDAVIDILEFDHPPATAKMFAGRWLDMKGIRVMAAWGFDVGRAQKTDVRIAKCLAEFPGEQAASILRASQRLTASEPTFSRGQGYGDTTTTTFASPPPSHGGRG